LEISGDLEEKGLQKIGSEDYQKMKESKELKRTESLELRTKN